MSTRRMVKASARSRIIVTALEFPAREGFDLSLNRLDAPHERLLLSAERGSAVLELLPAESVVFPSGVARLHAVGELSSRAFVDELAAWLGLDMEPSTAPIAGEPRCSWMHLADTEDGEGDRWTGYKLFFDLGTLHAEAFLRVAQRSPRAQFVEKWSEYRHAWAVIFERALGGSRVPRERPNKRCGDD